MVVINMERLIRAGPADCVESKHSTYDLEEAISSIFGVADIYGDDFGGPLEFSDHPIVVLYEKQDGRMIKGTPLEFKVKSEVERLLGREFGNYVWFEDSEEKANGDKPVKKLTGQQCLVKYLTD